MFTILVGLKSAMVSSLWKASSWLLTLELIWPSLEGSDPVPEEAF